MNFSFLILPLFCFSCVDGSIQNFSFSDEKCLSSFGDTLKVGDLLVKIYHLPNVSSISFSNDHTLTFPKSTRIVSIFLAFKGEDIKLARIVFCELENQNLLNDSFYHNKEGEWVKVEGPEYYVTFNELSRNIREFKLNQLSEEWFKCHQISESIICTIEDNYFVDKILSDSNEVWENKDLLVVNSIGLTIDDKSTPNNLTLKISYDMKGQHKAIEKQLETNSDYIKAIKKSLETTTHNTQTPKETEQVSNLPTNSSSSSAPESIQQRLKNIVLDYDPLQEIAEPYTIKKESVLELDCITYQPKPGVKITHVKDGKIIIWISDGGLKTFLSSKFYLKGDSPILLEISFQIPKKTLFSTTTTTINQYFKKNENGWYTLTNDSFQKEFGNLSSDTYTKRIQSGITTEEVNKTNIEDVPQPPKTSPGIRPRLDVTLELESDYKNNYIESNFLMDGLQTYYYEPKPNEVVKFVKDGKNKVWSSDNNKRIMKYAKFCYKGESPVFLSVLFSVPDEEDPKTGQPVKKLEYFIKRDQWYNSKEEDFERLLGDLINRVTMRDRILNEKITFDEHIQGLNIRLPIREREWYERLIGKKPEVIQLEPFEYDINKDGKDHFIIEANTQTKFGIYTPVSGKALTRLRDGDRVIWYQECDGQGCITLYMDFSGDSPLIHLILDDLLDTHKYYKKVENNWHLIDKDEYEEIREPPTSTPSQSDFTKVHDAFRRYIVVDMKYKRMDLPRSKIKIRYLMTILPIDPIEDNKIFHFTILFFQILLSRLKI